MGSLVNSVVGGLLVLGFAVAAMGLFSSKKHFPVDGRVSLLIC